MSGKAVITFLLLLPFFVSPNTNQVSGWGYAPHQDMTSQSIDLLPEPWMAIFTAISDQLMPASIAADLRKSSDPTEGPKHFDDSDIPHEDRNIPIDSSDYDWGVVSWAVEMSMNNLIQAIGKRDFAAIIRAAGDVAHYIADATQPFHATSNFDGQQTGNAGIHSRVEMTLISQYFDEFFSFSPSDFVDVEIVDPYNMTEKQIETGFALVPTFLDADNQAKEASGGKYDTVYYDLLNNLIGDLVKTRLKLAIQNIANVWYTAFVQASQTNQLYAYANFPNNTLISSKSLSFSLFGFQLGDGDTIKLYLNDAEEPSLELYPDGYQTYTIDNLLEGRNSIRILYFTNDSLIQTSMYFVQVDTVGPTVTLDIRSIAQTQDGETFEIYVYIDELVDSAKFYIDGGRYFRYNGTQFSLDPGKHVIEVIVIDFAGFSTTITQTIDSNAETSKYIDMIVIGVGIIAIIGVFVIVGIRFKKKLT